MRRQRLGSCLAVKTERNAATFNGTFHSLFGVYTNTKLVFCFHRNTFPIFCVKSGPGNFHTYQHQRQRQKDAVVVAFVVVFVVGLGAPSFVCVVPIATTHSAMISAIAPATAPLVPPGLEFGFVRTSTLYTSFVSLHALRCETKNISFSRRI